MVGTLLMVCIAWCWRRRSAYISHLSTYRTISALSNA
jgi:hypothetical protein